ncbi:MAG: ketoacyl-ACP synthase III [Bacteroidota bacterium]
MRNAVICSTGAYFPKRLLPNSYFNALLGEDVDTWLRTNLNIYQRHWCEEDESTADLCVHAAKQAMERAGIKGNQINLIIVATDTPEYITPATAAIVQFRLEAGSAGGFDLNAACAGFVTALDVAARYVRDDPNCNYALVIGAYAMSKYLDKEDKKTVSLFSDGAGAVILKAEDCEDKGYLCSELQTLGQYYDGMGIFGGGTRKPINDQTLANRDHLLKIVYRFPPELNPQMWTRMAKNLCRRLRVSPTEVDHYFLTQINIRSIRMTLDSLDVPHSKAHTIMDRYAYPGSAAIPIALDDAFKEGKIQPGNLIYFIGTGSGLSFASVAFRF